MALLRCDFFSEALSLSTSMTVVLPQQTQHQIGMTGAAPDDGQGFPTLYLLHGLSDDATIWTRRTSIERYVAQLGLAVVMPQVDRSFYTDERVGNAYWTFVSEELPQIAQSFFNLSPAREDTFVAGLSMGGYGAFKLALRRPERFAAAASLSGVLDIAGRETRGDWPTDFRDRIFGGSAAGTDDDLLHLLGRSDPSSLPRLYLCCGTEDELLADNHRFVDAAGRRGVPLTTSFTPGAHEWTYWDRTIQDVLAWLPLRREGRE
ncbi:alpha/beta hydrolase [Spongisporangium articulatum]|uniref:Alpha/beta hydrolase n=1 Tax=Spongisporangium articulatum TaxID=3362603 RepID=A0ABW8AJW8_9ACTN